MYVFISRQIQSKMYDDTTHMHSIYTQTHGVYVFI